MYAIFTYNSLISLYDFLRPYMDAMRLDSLAHIVYIDTVSFSWGGVCFGSFFVLVIGVSCMSPNLHTVAMHYRSMGIL